MVIADACRALDEQEDGPRGLASSAELRAALRFVGRRRFFEAAATSGEGDPIVGAAAVRTPSRRLKRDARRLLPESFSGLRVGGLPRPRAFQSLLWVGDSVITRGRIWRATLNKSLSSRIVGRH